MSVLREASRTLRPPPATATGRCMPMMVALTFVTGVVDAASYLKLGHVFVANMTGNIVFLGFALAGARRPVERPPRWSRSARSWSARAGGRLAGRAQR